MPDLKNEITIVGSPLNSEFICPVCFRDYAGHVESDGIMFCTSDDCPSHPDYVA